jgi:hypothetical protein
VAKIAIPGNQLRKDLTGQTLATLTAFLSRANRSGEIYAALYELTDKELIDSLVALKKKLKHHRCGYWRSASGERRIEQKG